MCFGGGVALESDLQGEAIANHFKIAYPTFNLRNTN